MLRWSNSAGYGVIHWTTRPLDLFFKNISNQVWTSSLDETLDVTSSVMAARTFGIRAQGLGTRYLLNWIDDAPAFGRETSDRYLDQFLDESSEEPGAKLRLALLARMMPLAQNAAERDWIGYYQDWEHYALDVYQAQSALQDSYAAQEAGKLQAARSAVAAAENLRLPWWLNLAVILLAGLCGASFAFWATHRADLAYYQQDQRSQQLIREGEMLERIWPKLTAAQRKKLEQLDAEQ